VAGTTKDKAAVTNVLCQLGEAAWTNAFTTNGWTNWTAAVTLTPGPNTVKAYALDSSGNASHTNSVTFDYVLTAPLTVTVTPPGYGTVTPDYNGASLVISNEYSMTAKADKGFGFVNWSWSGGSTNKDKLTFLMASNLVFTANFKEVTPPVLAILSPKVHQTLTEAAFTVTGKASDNVGVTNVFCQLNGTGWTNAFTTNGWTNWTAAVMPSPGANVVQAYAEDAAGLVSKTNSVKFDYALGAPLTVQVTPPGYGTVTPDYNGTSLVISNKYSMTAKPGKGFGFVNWSWSGGSTNKPKLTFVMASNLVFTANFVDVQRPVLAILSPKANAKVTAEALTVTGKASDNVGVTDVFCQLNEAAWTNAFTTDGWTNWTAAVTLSQSNNTFQAYAEDAAGNKSLTNTVKFTYTGSVTGPTSGAPASLSELSAEVTPTNDTPGFTISFGASTFSQSMDPGTNEDNNAVGNYTYARLSTNTALLTVTATAPPDNTNATVVGLTFTDSQHAAFSSTNGNGSVDTGAILLSEAANLVPASLAGKTIHAVESASGQANTVALNGNLTFKATNDKGKSSSGTYTFTSYSPVGALLVLTWTSPTSRAGDVDYVVVTFSAAKAGTYFGETVNSTGGTSTSSGTFTL